MHGTLHKRYPTELKSHLFLLMPLLPFCRRSLHCRLVVSDGDDDDDGNGGGGGGVDAAAVGFLALYSSQAKS